MDNENHYINCDICRKRVQSGPGRYEYRVSQLYKITVCDSCWKVNWDGWRICDEPKLLEKLKEHGLPIPARNSKGLLPRD